MHNKMMLNESQRSTLDFKQNFNRGSSHEGESVASILNRHEHLLVDIVRELKQKVTKGQFLSGLGSKVSLSDITNLTLDLCGHDQSWKGNRSFNSQIHNFEGEFSKNIKNVTQDFEKLRQQTHKSILDIQKLIQQNRKKSQLKQQQMMIMMKQGDRGIMQILEKKGDRSELDKIMNLTSLLAIQFQLIKKRFSNFQEDYNCIWKEISNIYSAQQNIKTVIDTEQKNSSLNLTRQKRIQQLFKAGKTSQCVNSLFRSEGQLPKLQQFQTFKDFDLEEQITKIIKRVQQVQINQSNSNYSLKIFSQSLAKVEQNNSQLHKSLNNLSKLKKQYETSKTDVQNLYNSNLIFKEQMNSIIMKKINVEIDTNARQIKNQIKQACKEITTKMMSIFDNCAKQQDISQLRNIIHRNEVICNQKNNNLNNNTKKNHQLCLYKLQNHDHQLKSVQRQVNLRLKNDQFQKQKALMITISDAQNLIKKTEQNCKNELMQFSDQQLKINEVLCSQNVIARWIWVSGDLKNGNLINWDRQVINTLPQNYILLKNQCCIKINNSGIYRFQLGFYAKRKPSIQILVNGQTIISAVNSNSYVVHHSSGRLKDICTSQVTGLTYYDFFTLPENSRVAISYSGDQGHGFLGLQRI